MSGSSVKPIVIIGGGPAGSVAALCLRKLGRPAMVIERMKFPRYRIGESLLPGTMAILTRLGVADKVLAAGFTKKRAATFIWGGGRPPWTFTFATPKTAPWVFDHAYQVNRDEFDQILLDAARERGADVHEGCEVTDVELQANGTEALVRWNDSGQERVVEADFVIDASGGRGVLAQKLKLRQFDEYYRNMAVWSYFKGGKRLKGGLEGNIFSVSFQEGWIWIIPLKDDVYSVGVVTTADAGTRMRETGPEAFYLERLKMCPLACELLANAKQCDEVRVLREWSYTAKTSSFGPFFLCGDAACFIDPLFSQGVHLATYSASLAAASIDHLLEHPDDAPSVHGWYDRSYRAAYERYHKFVAAFYACNDEPNSKFWAERKIQGAKDQRFAGKDWFASMTGQQVQDGPGGLEDLEERAATLASLWQHGTKEISDQYEDNELFNRRLVWANQLVKELQGLAAIKWRSREVRVVPSYRVHPTTFKLEPQSFVGDENGRVMTAYPLTDGHRRLFEGLIAQPQSFQTLAGGLKDMNGHASPIQIIGRLIEEGYLQGYDADGQPRKIRAALQFGGVGAEDDIS